MGLGAYKKVYVFKNVFLKNQVKLRISIWISP